MVSTIRMPARCGGAPQTAELRDGPPGKLAAAFNRFFVDCSPNNLDGSKNLVDASISDSIRLDGFGAKACGDSQGFSISMIG